MINKEIAILFQVVISEILGIFHSTLAIFVSARVAGGDRPIAVMSEKRRRMRLTKKIKKSWMMRVQHSNTASLPGTHS